MKTIPLTQGKVALVDDEDYEWLSRWKWSVKLKKYTCYAQRMVYKAELTKKVYCIRMHREIMGLKPGDKRQVDHIDDNGLNNQRHNLRICSDQENKFNKRKLGKAVSIFKGVTYSTGRRKCWRSRIKINKKEKHLGYFHNEHDAARAYNAAAIKYFKEFARLNVIEKEKI